ncbi:MAG TPA: ion channel [Allosphingosinicella sp.]
MIGELAVATAMVLLTVLIHAIGLYSVARLLRLEEREEAAAHIHPLSVRGFATTLVVILSLIALHGTEIWLYAFLYDAIGAVDGLRNAVYFSTTTYGAIGYDDAAMAEEWRLVSAIEGINGIILIGWSTAFFVMIVARMRRP